MITLKKRTTLSVVIATFGGILFLSVFILTSHDTSQKELQNTEIHNSKKNVVNKGKSIEQSIVTKHFTAKCSEKDLSSKDLKELFLSLKQCHNCQKEQLWKNIHYETPFNIYRLRTFIDENDNGSYEKIVLYKEDSNGFPQIMDIKDQHKRDDFINKRLQSGSVIHVDSATRFTLSDGKEITIKLKNQNLEFLEILSTSGKQDYYCDISQ